MSTQSQSRRFDDVRDMSVHPPIAAVWQTSQRFAFVPQAVILRLKGCSYGSPH